jgi:hypothetical protein
MIQFPKPINLNGDELLDELLAVGIVLDKWKQAPSIDSDGAMWLDIAEANKAKAAPIVAAHNGTIVAPEPTVVEKLASVGLSIEELKAALGGN